MNTCYKYTLEKYKTPASRYNCPNCGHKRTFTRYVDNQTGQYIAENVGICNRVNNCGYHYPPKQYFLDNNISQPDISFQVRKEQTKVRELVSYIKQDLMSLTLKNYDCNNFYLFLQKKFGTDIAFNACKLYNIGTSKHYENATIYWQIDVFGKVRAGKIMQYNPETGKRVKGKTNWVHSVLKFENFNLKQCLFGEHLLLTDLSKTVAVVESEKTAIIGQIYYPKYIWVATGSVNNLNEEKCRHLNNRTVIFFPDAGMYNEWQNILSKFKKTGNFSISGLLEENLSDDDKKQGFDIADFLLKYDLTDFN